ncbi:SAM-dependent methyltransferase [Streptomyces mobaraensis]|uniref:SAM-dependent methyltransferase n=1 Tax=Streptomyces mobaraensis TaxID=35621 RepID=UPI0033348AC9
MTDQLTPVPADVPAYEAGRWEFPPPSVVLDAAYFDRPNPAGVQNFLLDGHDHSSSDRRMAAVLLAADPKARLAARIAYRHRETALTYLAAKHRIRQVLVGGCGYPVEPYPHTVVGRYGPCRVVYADTDPVTLAYAHAAMSLSPLGHSGFVLADLSQPASLTGSRVREVIDFSQPVAVLLHHVLHLMPDPYGPLAGLKAMLASGSALSITHPTGDLHPRHVDAAVAATAAGMPVYLRSRDEIEELCAGWRLERNGVEPVSRWGRDRRTVPGGGTSSAAYAVIALKP